MGVYHLVLVDYSRGIQILPSASLGALGIRLRHEVQPERPVIVFVPELEIFVDFNPVVKHFLEVLICFIPIGVDAPRHQQFLCSKRYLCYAAANDRICFIVKQSPQYQKKSSLDCRRESLGCEFRIKVAVGHIISKADCHLEVIRHECIERIVIPPDGGVRVLFPMISGTAT